jgi:hypothetical protein
MSAERRPDNRATSCRRRRVSREKDWSKISEIEEYRLDWSGRRYIVQAVHRRALVLDEPLRLTVTFEDLQLP